MKVFKRILVVRSGGLGDFVLTLPLLSAIRKRWPEATLVVLGHSEIADLARLAGITAQIDSIDSFDLSPLFIEDSPGSVRRQRMENYIRQFDLVISFLQDREGTFAASLEKLRITALPVPPAQGESVHAAQQFLHSLAGLHLDHPLEDPRLKPTETDCQEAESLLASAGILPSHRLVAVHPGSGSEKKNWPLDRFLEVTRWISQQPGLQPILLTGEADGKIRKRLAVEPVDSLSPICDGIPIRVLVALLRRSELFLGNDSGVGHLAAAIGTPVISLFGPTSPGVWRPLGPSVSVIHFQEATVERVCAEVAQVLGLDRGSLEKRRPSV